MLRILIADDHPLVRRGLKQIIAETPDMVVADEAADGREALSKAATGDYDVVLWISRCHSTAAWMSCPS